MESRREWLIDGLHLFVLCGFAFAQPLFTVLAEGPEFFVARGSRPLDICLLATFLSLGVPALLVLVEGLVGLVSRTARHLRRRDPTVPRIEIGPQEITLLDDYLGAAYAHPTAEAQRAIELLARLEGLPLETTYTGKTMAALLDYARQHPADRILFVDTFAEGTKLQEGDYHALPERFWPVFDRGHESGCWCLRASREPGFCWRRS